MPDSPTALRARLRLLERHRKAMNENYALICAWCHAAIGGPAEKDADQVSHGICDECREEHFPEEQ